MKRRHFLRSATLATAAIAAAPDALLGASSQAKRPNFQLRYAPHPGMFKALAGDDYLDQIRFAADQGFTAWEDNGIAGQTPDMQSKIGQTLADHGMKMGVFVAYANFQKPSFAKPDPDSSNEILAGMENAVEVAKRVGAQYCTVVPGTVDKQLNNEIPWGGPLLSEGYQLANAIDLLRRCADIIAPHGLTMVLEPLNWHRDHGGVLLQYSDQAYALCRAVNSPACKILFDIYHQQISEGNLIPNIERSWSEIGYFQAGDNPGRKEPGTGEINYRNVFKYIHERARKENRDFVVGMEHGNSLPGAEGEQAVIDAYRAADSF
mgnify:CR=1 FL=1